MRALRVLKKQKSKHVEKIYNFLNLIKDRHTIGSENIID